MSDRKVLIGDPLTSSHEPWRDGDKLITPGETPVGLTPFRLVFNVSGLFDKTPYASQGYTQVETELVGGGGGGGGGSKRSSGTYRGPGQGGGGGGYTRGKRTYFEDLDDITYLYVGAGGSPGLGATVNDSSGTSGTQGGQSIAYYGTTWGVVAWGGNGGAAGGAAINTNQPQGGAGLLNGCPGGHASGVGIAYPLTPLFIPTGGVSINFATTPISYAGGGGGCGGAVDSGDNFESGGAGAPSSPIIDPDGVGVNGGTGEGDDGNNGSSDFYTPAAENPIGGAGGGGGAGNSVADGDGGTGGEGGRFGAGGGGGGGATNGTGQGGDGGSGNQGIVVLWLS